MKLKSFVAAALSAVITICSTCTLLSVTAETTETEKVTYKVSYNIDPERLMPKVTEEQLELFKDFELEAGEYVDIPKEDIMRNSTGWTIDGIFLREPGDFIKMPDHDIVIEPVFVDRSEYKKTLSYDVFADDISLTDPAFYKSLSYYPGEKVVLQTAKIEKEGWLQIGWWFEGEYAKLGDKFIMPNHDTVVKPRIFQYHACYYEAGTSDRLNGPTTYSYTRYHSNDFELPTDERFSRNGFKIVGWHCDYDDKDYPLEGYYTMPDSDVHFYAIWQPVNYTVVFKALNDAKEILRVAGETDTYITTPTPTGAKKGYEFLGWKDQKGDLYKAESDFFIEGERPGKGIALEGVWWQPNKHKDSLSLVEARKQLANGEITEEEFKKLVDFILGRK